MKQMNFDEKLEALSRKPQSHITQEDARELSRGGGKSVMAALSEIMNMFN